MKYTCDRGFYRYTWKNRDGESTLHVYSDHSQADLFFCKFKRFVHFSDCLWWL